MPLPKLNEEGLSSLLRRLWQHISARRRMQFTIVLGMAIIASFAEVLTLGAALPLLLALTGAT